MSIYSARLPNTSNALSPRVSSEQIHLQVLPKLFGSRQLDPLDNRAVNSRLLARLQKKHVSQRCRVELVELTVDDVWQIADAGDQELQRLTCNNRRRNLEHYSSLESVSTASHRSTAIALRERHFSSDTTRNARETLPPSHRCSIYTRRF